MHILHTLPGRNWGGMEHRTLDQVRWLNLHGHDVWLAAPGDGETFRAALAEGLPAVPMAFDRPWRPATITALRHFVRDHRVEVIDTHVTRDAKTAMTCLDLCAVVRTRHVNQPLKSTLWRRLQWRRGADHVITVADITRRNLVASGLAQATRSTTIGGWADETFFAPTAADADRVRLRAELGLTDNQTVILCVGMLRSDKGQDQLIAALGLLRRRGLTPVCLLAGAPTVESAVYAATLRRLALQRTNAGQVRFLGYRHDVAALMRAADLVVIPSLTEAQPGVAVQAFAIGCPVVASAVGGVPEIVEDGVTGWLVPAADPSALADAIAAVIADPAGAAEIAATAHARAEATMRFDGRMAETLATYQIAIDHAHARLLPPLLGDHP